MSTESTPPLQIVSEFEIEIEQKKGYEFRIRFDKEHYPELTVDEPAPLGADGGPNPSRLLAAAVGNCLSASLLFCASRARVPVGPVRAKVRAELTRNERGRLRIARMSVEIDPNIPEEQRENAKRCLALFEDFCVVTQSVREGLKVDVTVKGLQE